MPLLCRLIRLKCNHWEENCLYFASRVTIYPEQNRVSEQSEKIQKTGHTFFLPVPVYCTGVVCLCVSVFWKIMNNFWMHWPIWTKFSGLCWLVASNLRVGSTSAQSPPVRTGPACSPFPWSLSPLWSWVLLGHVMPFWKAFYKANHNVRVDFWFWTYMCTGGLCRCGLKGGHNILENWPIFHIIDLPWNQILRTFYHMQLFNRTSN